MTLKALYYDDQYQRKRRDAQWIKVLLDKEGELECVLKPPPQDPRSRSVLTELRSVDALLIDLDLAREPVNYYGSSLATQIRIANDACPIILITRAGIMEDMGPAARQFLEENNSIDLIVYKDDVLEDAKTAEVRKKITAVIYGFKDLAQHKGDDWDEVLELMGATDDERHLLREAAPPIRGRQWGIPQTSHWILNVIMGFPGILYDELTAATRLGIAVDSFQTPQVQHFFAVAAYTGPFHTYSRRWWRGRIFETAQRLIMKHELSGPTFQTFANAFETEYDQKLDLARCVYDGEPIADWVCFILQQPVKQQNSIPYYPDNRPAIMDQARVSFKAIRETGAFDEELVDADSLQLVRKLWE